MISKAQIDLSNSEFMIKTSTSDDYDYDSLEESTTQYEKERVRRSDQDPPESDFWGKMTPGACIKGKKL